MKNKYYQKKQYAFIVYEFDEFRNDWQYVKEYYTTKEIQKDYKIENVRQYTTRTIENIKHLINNKYIVIKEEL